MTYPILINKCASLEQLKVHVCIRPEFREPRLTLVSLLFPVEFAEVESDFHAKVPVVFCRDVARSVLCGL